MGTITSKKPVDRPPLPNGIEHLLEMASEDPRFLEGLLEHRSAVVEAVDVPLTNNERLVLDSISASQLRSMASNVVCHSPTRRVMLKRTAAAALALLGGTFAGASSVRGQTEGGSSTSEGDQVPEFPAEGTGAPRDATSDGMPEVAAEETGTPLGADPEASGVIGIEVPPGMIALEVTTTPTASRVRAHGNETCRSPCVIFIPEDGTEVRVRISKSRYESVVLTVSAANAPSIHVTLPLEEIRTRGHNTDY